jgi:hypothetical protein
MSSIVFDATALIHFSRAGRLRELQVSSTEDEAILLANVSKELEQGGPLRPTLDPAAAAWLKPADLTEMAELAAFASYRTQLGGRAERNNGEAAVLAWISINGGKLKQQLGAGVVERREPTSSMMTRSLRGRFSMTRPTELSARPR